MFKTELTTTEDADDIELTKNISDIIKATQIQHFRETYELKETLKALKNKMNAEKQKLFNEAIKRATQEKEKLIDELRQKETGYLEEIKQLKEALDKASVNTTASTLAAAKEEVLATASAVTPTAPILIEDEIELKTNLEEENVKETKIKLKELMYKEKIEQLEKRLSQLTQLPVTNDYETIQLNSCNIDDLVIAVYSEENNSYKIIHKSSNYMYFVHSAIFKSHEQRLAFKNVSVNTPTSDNSVSTMSVVAASAPVPPSILVDQSCSQFDMQLDSKEADQSSVTENIVSSSASTIPNLANLSSVDFNFTTSTGSPLVKNSPSDNVDNIFLKNEQPQWFIGRVLVKEFCIARRVRLTFILNI